MNIDSTWVRSVQLVGAGFLSMTLAVACGGETTSDAGPGPGTDAGPGTSDGGGTDSGAPLTDAGPPGPPITGVVINELVFNHVGMDTHEYIELVGDPNTDLSVLSLIVLEGDIDSSSGSPGVVDAVFAVGSTDENGFFLLDGLPMDSLENGTQTLYLVQRFRGAMGDDLDPDDDGVLDAMPWEHVIDEVAVNDGSMAADKTYAGASALGMGFDGLDEVPGGLSRLPNGNDTNMASDWTRNDFDGAGVLGAGTPQDGEALNTPGAPNALAVTPPSDVIINEFVANHEGDDVNEFIEVFGSANTDYSSMAIVVVDGDVASLGRVDGVFPLGTTDAQGYYRTPYTADMIENGTSTFLLVQFFAGRPGWDLDAADDGTLEDGVFTVMSDSVAILDGDDTGDRTYAGAPVLALDFDGGAAAVGGASRIPNGTDTDAIGDWVRNDFAGDGLPDVTAPTAPSGAALNTPGAANEVVP